MFGCMYVCIYMFFLIVNTPLYPYLYFFTNCAYFFQWLSIVLFISKEEKGGKDEVKGKRGQKMVRDSTEMLRTVEKKGDDK